MKFTKKIKKFIVCLMAVTVCCSALVVPTQASTTFTKERGAAKYFNNAWEKTTTYSKGNKTLGKMVWGYNTDWTHEDYVWTLGNDCRTTAGIFRDGFDTSTLWGDQAKVNNYSKWELTHKTYYVEYKIKFDNNYNKSEVTETTGNSSVK